MVGERKKQLVVSFTNPFLLTSLETFTRKRAGESKKLDLVDSTLWRPSRLNDLREFRFNIIRSLNSVESAIYFSRYFHQNPRRISKNAMRFFFFFIKDCGSFKN